MAFDQKPSTWIPNWSEDGTNITVPIASFPQMTAEEADATTGDIRKVVFALADKIYEAWNATASADRPTKMLISKSTAVDPSTGVAIHSFIFRFYNVTLSEDVMDEA